MKSTIQHFTTCLMTFFLMGYVLTASAVIVKKVVIESDGLTVDPSSVRPFLSLNPGADFSRQQIAKDVKALEKTDVLQGGRLRS